jgi:hypothetical protein
LYINLSLSSLSLPTLFPIPIKMSKMSLSLLLILLSLPSALSHGDHSHSNEDYQIPIDPLTGHKDWASWHMHSEHHLQGFDSRTFFTLHDPENTGLWSTHQIRALYGMLDRSTDNFSSEAKDAAVAQVLALYDTDRDGAVSLEEFTTTWDERGVRLPDLGMGPGHHGDEEYEYEIHHWEQYHGEDTKDEDLTHPEDIEHFKMHEEEDRAQEEWERERGGDGNIVDRNIPEKYLRVEF